MFTTYPKFKTIEKFNNLVVSQKSRIKYIVILTYTDKFVLAHDLNKAFKRNYEVSYYIELFKKHECYTVYWTLFTLQETRQLGPIARDISSKILSTCLEQLIQNNNAQIVGPSYLKLKWNVLSYDSFLLRLHN